jgi:16S rRNA G966 N2-methylase RsmD
MMNVYNLDYIKTLDEVRDIKFDIIYIDPPYNKGMGQDAIEIISSYDLLKMNGVLVFETDEVDETPENIGKYVKFKSKKYGRNILSFYNLKGELA